MTEAMKTSGVPAKILGELSKVIIGKDEIKELILVTLLSGGHILIEGLPGTGKTKLALNFARLIGGEFKRIQFTVDMLPADVTGYYLHNIDGTTIFNPGPIFANVVLADELNRTTPRTQAALLESMQEAKATIDGVTHKLPNPFIVIASQLTYGHEGTYPLTEVQIDRFMLRVWSGHASKEEEINILNKIDYIDAPDISPVTTPEEIIDLRNEVKKVHISPEVIDYIVTLVEWLRKSPDIQMGPSARASIALFKCSRSLAFLNGRDFVIPDDVKRLAYPVMEHRILVKTETEMDNIAPSDIVAKALKAVPVPKVS